MPHFIQLPRRGAYVALAALLPLGGCLVSADAESDPRQVVVTEQEPVGEAEAPLVSYDCSSRQDTGYTNGSSFTITVVTVGGVPVEVETANAFLTMAAAAEGAGLQLKLNSGFRTMAEQQYLYNCYVNQNCNGGNLAAKPGYSNHQSGHALDINMSAGVYDWLTAHGAAYGFKRTVPSENWHWEWWGGGSPKAYCCAGASCEDASLSDRVVAYAPPSTTDIDGDGRADVCARGGGGVYCHLAVDGGFGPEQLLVPLANAVGWDAPKNYATIRMGDVDGDNKADLCARSNSEFRCYTSQDTPLGTTVLGPKWSDANGWSAVEHWSTIRLADIDGDRKEDVCARAGSGMICHLSTGDGFGPQITGPAWSNAAGFAATQYYATLRTGDIDGDGRADLCIRASAGMRCALSLNDGASSGFGGVFAGPEWSDAAGWKAALYYNSIRMADVNGDGKADLCTRTSSDLRCHFSTGNGFGPAVIVAGLSNANGWDDPANIDTFRTGDINGDGAVDLCLRSNTAVMCWAWDGAAFSYVAGPALSDASGWSATQYYETVRLGDADGDGRADVCARASSGWACSLSSGDAFGPVHVADAYTDAKGWDKRPYYSTMFFASPVCRPGAEVCNGLDDDCDGLVDEGDVCGAASGSGGTGSTTGGGPGSASNGAGGSGGGGSTGALTTGVGGGGEQRGATSADQDSGCSVSASPRRGSGSLVALVVSLVGLALGRRSRPYRRQL